MKKIPYNATEKYQEVKFNPKGTNKADGLHCITMCLDYCKDNLGLDYDFTEKINDKIDWDNIVKLFNDNPEEVYKQVEKHLLKGHFEKIAPHLMQKGDMISTNTGIGGIKVPCIYVGGNKILITTKEGMKVIPLTGKKVFEVYRVKQPKKVITEAIYQLGENPEDIELIKEESYEYTGDTAECISATTAAWIAIISAVISLIAAVWMYFNQPQIPKDQDGPGIGNTINTRSTTEPKKAVYGIQRVGGNDVFIDTLGNNHKYLYMIQTLSEGVCEGIESIDGVDQIFLDGKIWTTKENNISYQFYSGTDTQTYDTMINAVKGEFTDNMRNTCYIRWKFKWEKDVWPTGKPNRTLNLKGIKCYDFRDDTTAWTQNGVLILYDYLTNKEYGLGVDLDYIDITSWTTASNYFDNKGWLFGYTTTSNKNPWAVVQDILMHFRGAISWFDGKYYLLVADLNEESSVMTITDKHIVQDGSGEAMLNLVQPSSFEKPNGIKIKFLDREKDYTQDEITLGEQAGVVRDLTINGYTDRETAGIIGTYQLERARLDRSISGTFRDDCLELAPYDLVTFNSTEFKITDQVMRVVSTSFAASGLISLTLQYESLDLYNDVYDTDIDGVYTCDLPDPNTKTSISNPQISEQTFYYRLRTESRLHITFDVLETEPWFKHVEVWQAIMTSGTVPDQSEYEHQFNIKDNFQLGPVEQGQTYYIVLIPVNEQDVKETFNSSPKLSHTVIGNSSAPQSLSYLSAIPSNSGLTLFSDKLEDPDIEVYEFRLGSQWSGGIFMSSKRSPQEALPGIKPGTFTFWCNPKGTNDIYGIDPQSATAKTQLPIGWSLNQTFSDDYTGVSGTFNNTEHTTYASEDYLMCTHSGTNYTGTYTSAEFDTGVLTDDYYMYLNADIVTTGAGTTWNDVTTSGTATGDDVNIKTRNWAEIFTIDEAPKVNITIYYKEVSGDAWSEVKNAEILSSVVNARYFKVEISIIDPASGIYAKVEHFDLKIYTQT